MSRMSDSINFDGVEVMLTPSLLLGLSTEARTKKQKYTSQNIFNMMRERAEKGYTWIAIELINISDDTIIHLEHLGFKHEIIPCPVDDFVIDDWVYITWGCD